MSIDDSARIEFGPCLSALLRNRNKKREWLAQQVGVDASLVRRWTRGEETPTWDRLLLACEALQLGKLDRARLITAYNCFSLMKVRNKMDPDRHQGHIDAEWHLYEGIRNKIMRGLHSLFPVSWLRFTPKDLLYWITFVVVQIFVLIYLIPTHGNVASNSCKTPYDLACLPEMTGSIPASTGSFRNPEANLITMPGSRLDLGKLRKNFRFSARFLGSDDPFVAYMIYFRMNSSGTGYSVHVPSDDRANLFITQYDNHERRVLHASKPIVRLSRDGYNEVVVECIGDEIRVIFNHQLEASVQGSGAKTGYFRISEWSFRDDLNASPNYLEDVKIEDLPG